MILMGGSGSTGSSLLKNILGRHPKIFGSQETSLFAKAESYSNWERVQKRIFNKKWTGLKNYGFHRYDRIDFDANELGWALEDIQDLAWNTDDVVEFANALFSKVAPEDQSIQWLEKTPANACCFQFFVQKFPNGKILHTVRDPLDTIGSLVARGQSPYYAASVYLCNTAAALGQRHHTAYHEVKYEELVFNPEDTLRAICDFFGISFHEKMLTPGQEKHLESTTMEGWHYDETEKVQTGAVNRFYNLPTHLQKEILVMITSLSLSDLGAVKYQTDITNILQIALFYEYSLPDLPTPTRDELSATRKRLQREHLSRRLRGYSGIKSLFKISNLTKNFIQSI